MAGQNGGLRAVHELPERSFGQMTHIDPQTEPLRLPDADGKRGLPFLVLKEKSLRIFLKIPFKSRNLEKSLRSLMYQNFPKIFQDMQAVITGWWKNFLICFWLEKNRRNP